MIIDCILESVGNTPLIKLPSLDQNLEANIYVKLEFLNPSGSIKDRLAKYIIEKAEKEGRLNKDSIIVEVSSGNTGIAFSMAAACRGYKLKILIPEGMCRESAKLIKAFGAEVIITPASEGFEGAIKLSKEMAGQDPHIFLPQQFENEDNIEDHYLTTGQEIIKQLSHIDAFVAGVGTGGTLMGVAKALKKINPKTKIIAVEPAESAVMSGKSPGPHKIFGIGEGFIPSLIRMDTIDDVIAVKSDDAVKMTKKLIQRLGLMVGISSGANVIGALETARKIGLDKNIVTLLPDRGERYFSTDLFED